jgi:DnaJ-class molecular chaperone
MTTVLCQECKGRGIKKDKFCETCDGTGELVMNNTDKETWAGKDFRNK